MPDFLHRFLDIGEPPRCCECIFVLAGRPERKLYGIDLWHQGYAPELILSIGRFEWRAFYTLGLPSDGGLKELIQATPPRERHFFVRFRDSGAKASLVQKSRLGTMTEGRALASQLHDSPVRSLMVVSSPIHLRRVALVFRHAFAGSGTDLAFVAAPETQSSTMQEVRGELIKFLLYRSFLIFPLRPQRPLR